MPALPNPLKRFGFEFADPALLDRALTHRSAGHANYERLEFLGDALVNTIVSIELYRRYPRAAEGDLTRLRSALIRESSLADIARGMELSEHLRMGTGELKSGGFRRDSILADTLEALVAAVFLDGGWDRCRALVEAIFVDAIESIDLGALKDPKTRLQELLQGRGLPLPEYTLVDTAGKDHDKIFNVSCGVPELNIAAAADGRSRKAAEQIAAAAVLELLERGAGG
jgi:ribonuclease-3